MNSSDLLEGSGLGLRRGMFPELRKYQNQVAKTVDFFEVAPENWINVGGRFGQRFRDFTEKFPIVCHGLSLSLGSPQPLDLSLLGQVREFLLEFDIQYYSDHLSACSDTGHLYDLMPIPFTESAVRYVAERIRTVQDFLERRIAIEHVSYYASPAQELSEIEFITSILDEADCNLLLDVNNAYVNGINFCYDPKEFLDAMPMERVTYIHIAGHYKEAEDLRVDTHAANVIEPVWELLEHVYSKFGQVPTLLERDFKFPPVPKLLLEVKRIKELQQRYSEESISF